MATKTVGAQALAKRLKNRRLPDVAVPITQGDELSRALQGIKEHLRMYEGDAGAPKERFVTLQELEDAGLVTADTKNKFSFISQVQGADVRQPAGTSDGSKRTVNITNTTVGASTIDALTDTDLTTPVSNEFLKFSGGMWKNAKLFGAENVWTKKQRFNEPLELLERAAGPAALAGFGYIWLKDDTPNTLWFTDDAGTEFQIPQGGTTGVPNGTVDDTMLRWDTTAGAWEEETQLRIDENGVLYIYDSTLAYSLQLIETGAYGQIVDTVNPLRFYPTGTYVLELAATLATFTKDILLETNADALWGKSSLAVNRWLIGVSAGDMAYIGDANLNGVQLGHTKMFGKSGKEMFFDNNDNWLRINNASDFTFGIYSPGPLRQDGAVTGGTGGSTWAISAAGAFTGAAFGGILTANLLSRAVTETISAFWTFGADADALALQKTTSTGYVHLRFNDELGVARWRLSLANATDDDLSIFAYNTSGVYRSSPLQFDGTTDLIRVNWGVDFALQVQGLYGMGGDYSSAGGSTTYGATIWSLDTTWQGGAAGANSASTSVYGLRYLRSAHSGINNNIGEGFYVMTNGSIEGGIGAAGIWSGAAIVAATTIAAGTTVTSGGGFNNTALNSAFGYSITTNFTYDGDGIAHYGMTTYNDSVLGGGATALSGYYGLRFFRVGASKGYLGAAGWVFEDDVTVDGGNSLIVEDSTAADSVSFVHGGTNFNIDTVNTTHMNVTGLGGNFWLRDGAGLKISDSTDADSMVASHDGADFNFQFTSTTNVDFQGMTNFRLLAGPIIKLYDSASDDLLTIQHTGSLVTFATGGSGTGSVPIKLDSTYLQSTNALFIGESAGEESDITAYGQIWVKNDAPNTLWFTDDAGGNQLIDPAVSEISTQNGAYTLVLGDKGKTIHKATSTASITHTIPANASVAFPLGTLVAFKNSGTVDMTIAITSDTLTGTDGSTGSRTLGAYQTAVIQKMTATTWEYVASDL